MMDNAVKGSKKSKMRKLSIQDYLFDSFNVVLMAVIFVVMLYPFIYVLAYSLSDPVRSGEGLLLFPVGFTITAFEKCLALRDVSHGFLVSVARTVIGSGLMVIVTSMAAYAISREDMLFVKFFRKFFIFTMYCSGGLIPAYVLMKALHLTNNFWVYIIGAIVSAFNMVLIKAYIENLPKGLEDAAVIDGANDLVLFYRVVFPLCKPVLAAVVLFTCVGHWNSYIDTQIYNSMNRNLFTLQYVLYNYMSSLDNLKLESLKSSRLSVTMTPKSLKMAITIITTIPIVCLYPFLQRYFTSGLLMGSVKA